MIESRESGLLSNNNQINIKGYYQFNNIKISDKYREALDVFFSNGVKYKNEILLSSISTPLYTVNDMKFIFNNVNEQFKIKCYLSDYAQKDGNLQFLSDNEVYIKITYNIGFGDELISPIITEEHSSKIDDVSVSFINDRAFEVTFKMLEDIEYNTSKFILNTNSGYLWKLEQSKIQEEGDFLSYPPIMDCTDFISFLWSLVNYNTIIKEKIFSCDSLIENKFENIKFLEQIYSNNYWDKYGSYKELLKNLLPGDILIFYEKNIYHAILIVDPTKEEYTECSGYIEYSLGSYYNGKLNPILLNLRFDSLKINSTVYLCRLYKNVQ